MITLPELEKLPYGTQLPAGMHVATVIAELDFETYSEAGYVWDHSRNKWGQLPGVQPTNRGLSSVGVVNYSQHPTFEPLCMWYDLKDGNGPQYWDPRFPNPQPLFDHVASGRLLEAWNVGFERRAWRACQRLYGWPALPTQVLRCAMAKSRAHGRPGALKNAATVAGTTLKDKMGDGLIKVFCVPVNPTIKRPSVRNLPHEMPDDFAQLQAYCLTDIKSEAHVSAVTPDLLPIELEYWQADQDINDRGVHVDIPTIDACIKIIDQAQAQYGFEMQQLTGGIKPTELQQLRGWCAANGYSMASMDEDAIELALSELEPFANNPFDQRAVVYRVLQLRSFVGSASVKKVFAMRNQSTHEHRLHDLFSFHAARTGRPTGNGPQPTNLPKAGPNVWLCVCGKHYGQSVKACPWCWRGPEYRVNHKGNLLTPGAKPNEWSPEAAADAIQIVGHGSLKLVEFYFGDAMLTLAGCLRGLFTAAPGHDLVSSDYTAIEAVVLACLAGEQWRIELFATGGKIYEKSGALVTGLAYEDVLAYKAQTGQHHPARQIGKTAELGLGYQGWVGAWRAFDDSDISDDEIVKIILAWRAASPAIVEFWGGQSRRNGRNLTWERYGVEGAFIDAILNPGREFDCRGLKFQMVGEAVYITLLSGRRLTYHNAALHRTDRYGCEYEISYWGWNSNPKNGGMGWIQIKTWGGRLVENIGQAVANDVLRFATVNLEANGYPVVLHVYDELVSEVPKGYGSIENFEAWMGYLPHWAVLPDGSPWPIKAAGGWRGLRYRKG